ECEARTRCPWIRGGARDTLTSHQIGSWAAQDLKWGDYYVPAALTVRSAAGLPDDTRAAFDWLDGNSGRELSWLQETARTHEQVAGAGDEVWPEFLGYGCYAQVAATRGLLEGLTVVWACEEAYRTAWNTVRRAGPAAQWARWAADNWGGGEFGGMMEQMSRGLDAAAAAAG